MIHNSNNLNSSEITKDKFEQIFSFFEKLIEYMDDIDAILKEVALHYDADRAYVFELSEDGESLNNTYEWCKEGVEPQIETLQNVPYDTVSVWFDEFNRVGAFFISSLDKDVEANSLTYEILQPQGIESLITAPIYKNERIIGFIGVDNPLVNTDDIVVLKSTASILYSELSRKIAQKNQTIQEITQSQLKQDADLGEIKDIIASANMGMWRIEIVDGEEPRMYTDETMMKLLGIYGQEKSPEITYIDWFSNVTPDAVMSVLNSVERMKQGYFDENTYLWNHPTKGIRYVRCGGTSKQIPGGYSLQGYHYDVDDVVRKDLHQMKQLQKALNDKKEYYDTLGAVSDLYFSMHIIDLTRNRVDTVKSKELVKEIVNHKNGASDMMKQVMYSTIADDYLESALEFTDLSTVAERMCGKKIISREFVGKNIGWFLASFITMERDNKKRPTKVIFATRVIDEEMKQKEKLIYKTQTDEMTGLFNRRAYEEKIYEYNAIPLEEKFIYVSIDANGLKIINDNIGHAAGDEMLIGVAQCMKKSMGAHGHLYRIGGDEFVAILFCDKQEIQSVLATFDYMLDNWTGKLVNSLSVSYGWISKDEMPEASTRQLGAIAEKRMYDAKMEYYQTKGIDRRGQREAHRVLCSLYTKILKINISYDSYEIINMDSSEQIAEKGFADKLSEWLSSFGTLGNVHPEDLEDYIRVTDLEYMREYFKQGNSSLHIIYRRKSDEGYKRTMMEIVPANDYNDSNQKLFMYVKEIG